MESRLPKTSAGFLLVFSLFVKENAAETGIGTTGIIIISNREGEMNGT
jgi:hypothetical protein